MSDFRIQFDLAQFRRDIGEVNDGFVAVERTVRGTGTGEVLTSRRKKLRGESKRPVHGMAIANFLRDRKGVDPFDFSESIERELHEMLDEETNEAIEEAYKSGRSQRQRLKRAVHGAAISLAEWTVEHIKSGGLGRRRIPQNKGRYFGMLETQHRRGLITKKYGWPPPVGIMTGRFVEGIRARWRLGRESF